VTSLPKRGDRVLVTEVSGFSPGIVGREFELSHDLKPLKRTPGFFAMSLPETTMRVHAVKVEILERATTRECAQCSPVFTEEPAPCAICKGTRRVPLEAPESDYTRGRREGMRRVVEIAERLRDPQGHGMVGRLIEVAKLKEAVDKELKDG
jgi:hypothetical protein